MNLIRCYQNWNPFRELERLQGEFSRGSGLGMEAEWLPALDIRDSKDSLVVKADLPGMNKEDIQVAVEDDLLIIKGEKKKEEKKEEKDFVHEERIYGMFTRTITLPATVDSETVKAVYKNGVLELTLLKKEEAKPKHKKINIES